MKDGPLLVESSGPSRRDDLRAGGNLDTLEALHEVGELGFVVGVGVVGWPPLDLDLARLVVDSNYPCLTWVHAVLGPPHLVPHNAGVAATGIHNSSIHRTDLAEK